MCVVSIISHSGLESCEKNHLEKAEAFVLSDSSFAERCLLMMNTPGHTVKIYGLTIPSRFHQFERGTSGIGGMLGSTCVSWISGKIDGKTVIFIHPISNTINYSEMIAELKKIKDIPVVENSDMFYSDFRNKVK